MHFTKTIRRHINLISLFVTLLFLSVDAFSAPQIQRIEGLFNDQQMVTVYGANFGNKNPAPPLLIDFVDTVYTRGNKTNPYSNITDNSEIPFGPNYPYTSTNNSEVLYTTNRPHRGKRKAHYYSRSGKFKIESPSVLEDPGQNNLTLYITWYYKPSQDPDVNGGSNKFIRVWDQRNGEDTRISWTQMHLTHADEKGKSGQGGPEYVSWGNWSGSIQQWNRMEFYVNSSAHIINALTNGELIHDRNNFYKANNGIGLNPGLIGFDTNVQNPSMITEISEVYIDNTPARVEISENSKWSTNGMKKEIQIPISWANNKIEFIVNQGAMSDLNASIAKKRYLYIIDNNGNVNTQGYPLSCENCPSPPLAPTNVNVF